MSEYLRALHQQFVKTPPGEAELIDQLEQTSAELKEGLDHSQRRLLLRLIDQAEELRDEVSLNSFLSGFRLACGLWRELSDAPPYSFDDENEKQASRNGGA